MPAEPNFVFSDNQKIYEALKNICDTAGFPPFSGTVPNFVLSDNLQIWEQLERIVLSAGEKFAVEITANF